MFTFTEKSNTSMRDKMSQVRMNVRPGQITASTINERNRDDFKRRYAEQQRKKKGCLFYFFY